jgi:RNA polymerase sigma-70 factor (ECF subfamily)
MHDGREETAARARPVVYCVVPRELAAKLHDFLRRHFRDDRSIEVIVERRSVDRRGVSDRRGGETERGGDERRLIRSAAGRRSGERRAMLVPVSAPELPRRARGHAAELLFVERLEPSSQEAEDRDTARLVMRIQSGQREAFADLYMRYFDRVYGYLLVALNDPHKAEDASQQVFVNLLDALPRYEYRGAPFRAWLFTIVRNQTLSQLRRRSHVERTDSEAVELRREAESAKRPAEPQALGWITDPELLLFVERLPLAQRQVLLLRFTLDLSHAQIAEILGRSPSDVRALQTRALAFLRRRLEAIEIGDLRRRDRPLHRCRRQAPVLRARRWALSGR